MRDQIDIIGGYDSLDDILHSTGFALQQTTLDDLRRANHPRAKVLLHRIQHEINIMLNAVNTLQREPGNQDVRSQHTRAANALHTMSAEASDLLAELQG